MYHSQTAGSPRWLGLETNVTILDDASVPDLTLRFFRMMQGQPAESDTITWFGQPRTVEEFRRLLIEEQRILYRFEIERHYGLDRGRADLTNASGIWGN